MTFVGASLVDAAIIFWLKSDIEILLILIIGRVVMVNCVCMCLCMFVNVNGLSIVILHPEYMSNVKGFTSLID